MPRAAILIFCALLFLPACTKQSSPVAPAETVNPLDHVDSAHVQPIRFLHKSFPVRRTVHFELHVPAHTALPRLHGTFKSYVVRAGQDPLADDSADVELVLLNADQFADFSQGRNGAALYTVEPTHDHEVDFLLSPTQDDSVTYFIVFRNAPGGAQQKQVDADFSLQFGYQ